MTSHRLRPAHVAGLAVLAAIAVACGGSVSSGSPASSAATQPPAASAPAASAPAVQPSGPGQPSASTATQPSTAAGGTLPTDACSLVTTADVEAAFGGTAAVDTGNSKAASCEFSVSGKTNAGGPGTLAVGVSVVARWSSYATIAKIMGDAVTEVKGLGVEAWRALGVTHLHVGGGDLAVAAIGVGDFTRSKLDADAEALAKALAAKV